MSLSKWEKNRRRNEWRVDKLRLRTKPGSRRLAEVVNDRWDSAY